MIKKYLIIRHGDIGDAAVAALFDQYKRTHPQGASIHDFADRVTTRFSFFPFAYGDQAVLDENEQNGDVAEYYEVLDGQLNFADRKTFA